MEEHDPSDIRGNITHEKELQIANFNSPAMTAIQSFMHLYKECVERTTGTGLKLTKFHQLLHNCRTISEHGSLQNVDSGRPESTHKVMSKDPARKTQKRKASLIEQTAKRLSENAVVTDAKSIFTKISCDQEVGSKISMKYSGSKFHLDLVSLGFDTYQININWRG